MVESVATDFPSLEGDVVSPLHLRRCTQTAQTGSHLLGIFAEKGFHGTRARHQAYHDVIMVCKDAAATAFPADNVDPLRATEVHIHLLVGHLVAAHHHRGTELPGKEVVVRRQVAGHIFLGSQVKRSALSLGGGGHFHKAGGESRNFHNRSSFFAPQKYGNLRNATNKCCLFFCPATAFA